MFLRKKKCVDKIDTETAVCILSAFRLCSACHKYIKVLLAVAYTSPADFSVDELKCERAEKKH